MSAITPTTLLKESAGSLTLHLASFAAGAVSEDTWASGIPGMVYFEANNTGDLNTTTNSGSIWVRNTSGTTLAFHMQGPETLTGFTCLVLSKS